MSFEIGDGLVNCPYCLTDVPTGPYCPVCGTDLKEALEKGKEIQKESPGAQVETTNRGEFFRFLKQRTTKNDRTTFFAAVIIILILVTSLSFAFWNNFDPWVDYDTSLGANSEFRFSLFLNCSSPEYDDTDISVLENYIFNSIDRKNSIEMIHLTIEIMPEAQDKLEMINGTVFWFLLNGCSMQQTRAQTIISTVDNNRFYTFTPSASFIDIRNNIPGINYFPHSATSYLSLVIPFGFEKIQFEIYYYRG